MKKIMMVSCLTFICFVLGILPVIGAEKVIELTVNDYNPPPSNVAKAWDEWKKWVEERSRGRLKINVHHGGALLGMKESYRGTQSGIVDISHYVVERREGFLLNTITTLPFLNLPPQMDAGKLYLELLDKFPEMRGEWKGVKILSTFMMPPTHIHTKRKQIKTPEDLKGLKMHGAEYAVIAILNVAGATPVELPITDMYMGLERGIIDGALNHFPVCYIFRTLELMPFHTVFGEGGINMTPMYAIINEEKFNSFPPDIQKILEESGTVWMYEMWKGDTIFKNVAIDFCKEKRHTFTYLTPDEIKPWYNLVKAPIHDKWIKEAEAAGLPGRAVYEETLKLIDAFWKKRR